VQHDSRYRFRRGVRPGKIAWVALIVVLGCAAVQLESRAAEHWPVITWGDDSPDWDQKLHVTAVREGCSGQPSTCVGEIKAPHGEKLFLSILLKTAIPGNYGAQYGLLARQNRSLVEIGADDFVGQYEKLFLSGQPNPTAGLTSLIDGIKAGDPNLGFGLTIYEDELQSPYVADDKFPAGERAKVNYVHFYIHYRADSPNVASYLPQLKTVFPNAKVILGVYAYDRISYLPCSKGGQPCTAQQEEDYMRQGLDADLNLVKDGSAAGIEFWPGAFGREDEWTGWDQARICPGRKSECVQNMKQMHQIVAQEFSRAGM